MFAERYLKSFFHFDEILDLVFFSCFDEAKLFIKSDGWAFGEHGEIKVRRAFFLGSSEDLTDKFGANAEVSHFRVDFQAV